MPQPTTQVDVRVFTNREELSRAAAATFKGIAQRQIQRQSRFHAALSGGSTPERLYQLLAGPEYPIDWDRVHLFQVDERCVPPDDPASNYRMIRNALLSQVAIPDSNFHRMQAEASDLEAAARLYQSELSSVVPPEGGGPPRLDLIILGMGADGHTASLFPNSPALQEEKLLVCANYVASLGAHRLTLTFPVLNAAGRVIFLVSGPEKSEALHQVLEGPYRPDDLPAQRVNPAAGELTWFVDQPAARRLTKSLEDVP